MWKLSVNLTMEAHITWTIQVKYLILGILGIIENQYL